MSDLTDAIESLKWAADGEFSARVTPPQARALLNELDCLGMAPPPLPPPSTVARVAIEKGIGGGTREVRYRRSCPHGHDLPASFAGLYCPTCDAALALTPA